MTISQTRTRLDMIHEITGAVHLLNRCRSELIRAGRVLREYSTNPENQNTINRIQAVIVEVEQFVERMGEPK